MMAFDVVVVGGGQAGLAAAITAAEQGVSVALLEKSGRATRGGNSRHTRNLRPMHQSARFPLEGCYGFDEYLDDLLRVTAGNTDESMARLTLTQSAECVDWLVRQGVDFQKPLRGTLHLGRTNAFFLGGGKALVNALYQRAEQLGVIVIYEAEGIELNCLNGLFQRLTYRQGSETYSIQARSLVAAAGGFEANLEWLAEGWGDAADNFLVRGTPHNRGDILAQLLASGCQRIGEVSQCHAVAIDGRV